MVTWDRWRFHVRPDPRVGTIISTATCQDGDRQRPVLYRAHLSEIFVPYMDPRREWSTRAFIDAGEYAAGGLADTLQPGIDCPSHAVYMFQSSPEISEVHASNCRCSSSGCAARSRAMSASMCPPRTSPASDSSNVSDPKRRVSEIS